MMTTQSIGCDAFERHVRSLHLMSITDVGLNTLRGRRAMLFIVAWIALVGVKSIEDSIRSWSISPQTGINHLHQE